MPTSRKMTIKGTMQYKYAALTTSRVHRKEKPRQEYLKQTLQFGRMVPPTTDMPHPNSSVAQNTPTHKQHTYRCSSRRRGRGRRRRWWRCRRRRRRWRRRRRTQSPLSRTWIRGRGRGARSGLPKKWGHGSLHFTPNEFSQVRWLVDCRR